MPHVCVHKCTTYLEAINRNCNDYLIIAGLMAQRISRQNLLTTTTVTWTGDGWKKDVGPSSSDGRAPDA